MFADNGMFANTDQCTTPFNNGTLFCNQYANITQGEPAKGALACGLAMEGYDMLVTRGFFLGYSLCLIAIMLAFLYTVHHYEKKELTTPLTRRELMVLQTVYGTAAGSSGGLASATISLWQTQFAVAGGFGCIEPITNALVWLSILAMGVFEVGQIYFVNKGIVRFPVNVITTMEVISNSVVAGLAGTIAFEGLACFKAGRLSPALYTTGILLEIVGCVVMVAGNYNDGKSGDGDGDGDGDKLTGGGDTGGGIAVLEMATTPAADSADSKTGKTGKTMLDDGGEDCTMPLSEQRQPSCSRPSKGRSSKTIISGDAAVRISRLSRTPSVTGLIVAATKTVYSGLGRPSASAVKKNENENENEASV